MRVLGKIEGCPVAHGVAMDASTGRLLFGCQGDTLVVGTRGAEAATAVGRISYPEKQRVAAFLSARNRVYWGYTEGALPLLYRLNLAETPYRYSTVPVSASIRQNVTSDGALLLALARGGELEIRDGESGALLRSVRVAPGWATDFHEHVDKAILPDSWAYLRGGGWRVARTSRALWLRAAMIAGVNFLFKLIAR
jgi:hypothetical protein